MSCVFGPNKYTYILCAWCWGYILLFFWSQKCTGSSMAKADLLFTIIWNRKKWHGHFFWTPSKLEYRFCFIKMYLCKNVCHLPYCMQNNIVYYGCAIAERVNLLFMAQPDLIFSLIWKAIRDTGCFFLDSRLNKTLFYHDVPMQPCSSWPRVSVIY